MASSAKAKFKCKACDRGFSNKQKFEKHKKSKEHLDQEKKLDEEQIRLKAEEKKASGLDKKEMEAAQLLEVMTKYDPLGQGIEKYMAR